MQYKYLVKNFSQQDIFDRKWAEIRWDFERVFHLVITKACDNFIMPSGQEGDDMFFTVTIEEPLTEEQEAWLIDHLANKERWGTLKYPVNGKRNDDAEYVAHFLKEATNNACFFRGFHGNGLNIGCERELTDEEKLAVENELGYIVWN